MKQVTAPHASSDQLRTLNKFSALMQKINNESGKGQNTVYEPGRQLVSTPREAANGLNAPNSKSTQKHINATGANGQMRLPEQSTYYVKSGVPLQYKIGKPSKQNGSLS